MKHSVAALQLLARMSRRARIHSGMLLGSFALLACGDSGSTTLPNGLPSKYVQVDGSNTMQATIDGVAWSGKVYNSSFGPGERGNVLRFAGISNPYLSLWLQVVEVNGPGVYPLTGESFRSTAAVYLHPPQDGWHPTVGSVTVVEISPQGATGTFFFTAKPGYYSKETGQLVVSNGRFEVTF